MAQQSEDLVGRDGHRHLLEGLARAVVLAHLDGLQRAVRGRLVERGLRQAVRAGVSGLEAPE